MEVKEYPDHYSSKLIQTIKSKRKEGDPRKKDFKPLLYKRRNFDLSIARHFGFCFGVENAVNIAYKAVKDHQSKVGDNKIYLYSEMIHNPFVNQELKGLGVEFLNTSSGKELIPLSVLKKEDIVILPAFGVSVEVEDELVQLGVNVQKFDTTCPFVRRVWKKGKQLADKNFSVVIHGKPFHEETKATFSRISKETEALIVMTLEETGVLCSFIESDKTKDEFNSIFGDRVSDGFIFPNSLGRLAVVNQTTMLADETAQVASMIKASLAKRYGEESLKERFADTRDTLCYATSENQKSVNQLLLEDCDAVFVVGGFNSSNTTHLAKICSRKFPTFHISCSDDLISDKSIRHRCTSSDIKDINLKDAENWLEKLNALKKKDKLLIGLTAGASTPDSEVEKVIMKLDEIIH